MERWWHDRVVYQIYPRSFADSDGDGIGDINGIISRLDYLHALGIGLIWLSPVFRSPMADNGYDISDYEDIAPEFGSMADMERLIAEAKARDIGLLLDLVVNHTSNEHPWFLDARSSQDSAHRDFYTWREGNPDQPPNAMRSVFGGPAWSWDEVAGAWYFHNFAREQPDLNWANPEVRAEVHAMMNRWLDRGIAGFRMDVIDLIGKDVDKGIVADGPMLHDYLREMHEATLAHRDVLTVGEAWSATPGSALLYSGDDRRELSMVFQFEHVTQQWDTERGKWRTRPLDLVALKAVLDKWQYALADDGWNALFWGNHDLPRAVSRYGDAAGYHAQSAKMLATVLHLMKGTPYVYQGEEIGMTNASFSTLEQFRDVETHNFFREHVEAGLSPGEFIAGANASSRDNARTPMQWTANPPNAGFTTGVPWIEVNPNFDRINVEHAMADELSIWSHYRKLIALRKRCPLIVYGAYQAYLDDDPQFVVYTRNWESQRLVVVANFLSRPGRPAIPSELLGTGEILLTNGVARAALDADMELAPYEAFAMLLDGAAR